MLHSQGKFCIDRNLVRWTLLDGIINRKTLQDEPMGGQELPIKQVMAVEKATGKKVERLPFGWPAALFGMGLLAVVWWAGGLFVRLVGGLGGLACLYWGAKRIPARTTVLEGYQIVAPGVKQEDWLVLGSTPEVIGFIEGLKSEMARETQALRVQ
jgi:hypothetical protein